MRIRQFPSREQFVDLAGEKNVIPVCIEILADTETPVSLLKKIRDHQKPVFLFESVEGGERWGRYSFLGTRAHSQIRVYSQVIKIVDNSHESIIDHGGKPFDVLKKIMSRYNPAQLPGLPRFWGGLVGYLTYESVSFFERIPHQWPDEKPLADFFIPDELIIFDNIRHTLMAIAVTFPEGRQNAMAEYDFAIKRIENLLEVMTKPLFDKNVEKPMSSYKLKPSVTPDQFRQMVRSVKGYIAAGDIIQAVISQPFSCDAVPDLWNLYRAQRFVNPSPYLYFMEINGMALVGSSPETMVRLENRVATLRPIAGTRPRGKNEQEDRTLADELLKDEKERAEHLMLVDLGRNDLGRVAEIGSVQVTDLMIVERYSHVMHLVSNICCDLRSDCDAFDLLAATFPAGTLSGAPKIRAMEIIYEMEKESRGPYGGAVGYISFSGNMDMAITIRTACIENNRLIVRAGAGIVADSNPEHERVETVNKAMAIQRALELVEQSNHF
ncbi:MAG: chorismate-binding protein [Desulfobacterales bacterium]